MLPGARGKRNESAGGSPGYDPGLVNNIAVISSLLRRMLMAGAAAGECRGPRLRRAGRHYLGGERQQRRPRSAI